jgi:hypothetical protein
MNLDQAVKELLREVGGSPMPTAEWTEQIESRIVALEEGAGSLDGCNASINRQLDKHLARIYAVEQTLDDLKTKHGNLDALASPASMTIKQAVDLMNLHSFKGWRHWHLSEGIVWQHPMSGCGYAFDREVAIAIAEKLQRDKA